MNCARILGNKLSLLSDFRCLTSPFYAVKQFSSLLGAPLSRGSLSSNQINTKPIIKPNLNLVPVTNLIVQNCGFRVRGKPKLRCKHCYYAGIEGVLHVFCDKYPRHKQRALTPGRKKYGWILTSATQSKYRPY